MTESVSQFRVGGVYRDVTNSLVRLDEACVHEGEAGWARASIFDKRYGCWQSYLALFCLSDGCWHGKFSAMNLAPGELIERDGQWVPVEQKLSFPSGSVLTTSGDKIVGREEPADAILERLDELIANDQALFFKLRDMRGGCSCHISPPCNACCEPLTMSEAEDLGLLDEEEPAPEPIRPALTWRTETPFDPFKGFVADTIYSGYVDWPAAQNHPLQRLNDGGPVNGSASLLKTA